MILNDEAHHIHDDGLAWFQAIQGIDARMRQRTIDVARTPGQSGGSHVLSYSTSASGNEAAALCGSPDDIARKLEALQAVGVHVSTFALGSLPYLATIVVLVAISADQQVIRRHAPASLGLPFHDDS